MTIRDPGVLALALVAGGALGAMFYGGLWWTVLRGASSATPARWFLASVLLRMGVTLAGFYVVAGGQADRLVACLLGFGIAHMAITRLTRPRADSQAVAPRTQRKARHAP
ncbi:ATP synthase subunit I [Thiomonas sp. FB-6]|uniref:ATP synthase subunit I n=1 Tax=Thiomonas sp. FB-6 TaxID=1158291 RepID=UPI00037E6142|nr:ATP synthase subunit I [Thiomonas sp. FB-6]